MESYALLPHMADTRIQLKSDSFRGLFRAGMDAIASIMGSEACRDSLPCPIIRKVSVQAPDRTCLLVDFLSDLLTQSHLDKAVFCELRVLQVDDTHILAYISGQHQNGFKEDIKAVTYHEAQVEKDVNGNFNCLIVLDI